MVIKELPKSKAKFIESLIKSSELVTYFKDDETKLSTKPEAVKAIAGAEEILLKLTSNIKNMSHLTMTLVHSIRIVMNDDEWFTVYATKHQARKDTPRHLHADLKL